LLCGIEPKSLAQVCDDLTISDRQLRRLLKQTTGLSPKQLQQASRLAIAKKLLSGSNLSVTDIAFSSGFDSVRAFNQTFKTTYNTSPSEFRSTKLTNSKQTDDITFTVGFRPPYLWQKLLNFFAFRALTGVEHIEADVYSRTIELNGHVGDLSVACDHDTNRLIVTASKSLISQVGNLIKLIERVFDLGCRPDQIASDLSAAGVPGNYQKRNLGLRLPGSFSGFELVLHAVLGQQITVKAATTLCRRFCEAFCAPYQGANPALTLLPPDPNSIAKLSVDDIASLGVISRRAQAIIDLAQMIDQGQLNLNYGSDPNTTGDLLQSVKGIGPWTANYIAMRALSWPDALPKEDIALRNALGKITPKQVLQTAEAWRPWRSYACLHLWDTLND
jgi:AraC family transcriptional regulator of adaptative response / DNA-3-methyladenine glycosylase II